MANATSIGLTPRIINYLNLNSDIFQREFKYDGINVLSIFSLLNSLKEKDPTIQKYYVSHYSSSKLALRPINIYWKGNKIEFNSSKYNEFIEDILDEYFKQTNIGNILSTVVFDKSGDFITSETELKVLVREFLNV